MVDLVKVKIQAVLCINHYGEWCIGGSSDRSEPAPQFAAKWNLTEFTEHSGNYQILDVELEVEVPMTFRPLSGNIIKVGTAEIFIDGLDALEAAE